MRLKNRVALITGGVSGIGKAHSLLFANEGAKVIIVTKSKLKEGEELAHEIREKGGEAFFLKMDVTKEEEWNHAIQQIIGRYGKLNILVNNAGISLCKDIENTTIADWNSIMMTNAAGPFLGAKAAIEVMKLNQEDCSIINISSIDALIGESGLPAYCASKGAVTAFTKAIALSCAASGYKIRVNSVHPGYIHTELTEKEATDSGLSIKEYLSNVGKLHPIGYIGEPIDVAYASLYLASEESRWVTGAEIVVDGGYTAQ